MEKSLFVDFCQIFKNKKSKIRHFGLCRHFERFSKTLFYKVLVLLSTTKQVEIFEKYVFLNFGGKKIDFRPAILVFFYQNCNGIRNQKSIINVISLSPHQ
jgi:hypothetical protein